MMQTEIDAWLLFAVGALTSLISIVFTLRYGIDWMACVVLFAGGMSLGLAFGILGVMRTRMWWNRRYGVDLYYPAKDKK